VASSFGGFNWGRWVMEMAEGEDFDGLEILLEYAFGSLDKKLWKFSELIGPHMTFSCLRHETPRLAASHPQSRGFRRLRETGSILSDFA